jgi:glycosyltransferase involved in cell wall biosynthesis
MRDSTPAPSSDSQPRATRSISRVIEPATPKGAIRKIAMLGNHLPRQCGIATFTTNLSEAISDAFGTVECFVLAMNDATLRHDYPPRVRFELAEADLSAYREAAQFLNANPADVVSVQHEYGIFGGEAGSHVLHLLAALHTPIVTTLHTLLAEPVPAQRLVMDQLVRLSNRLVVMSERGAALLREVHHVPAAKIDLIPHGIPTLPFTARAKQRLGVEGKSVLLTFGLLSPDKGIEQVLDALPAILEQHPNTVYFLLGATHPHVKAREGERYRMMLQERAQRLGVASHVVFHNRFVSESELHEFLSAADIYLTPYLKVEQITSGTLAYAIGSGKAVISTPYWYARELLADGRGILIPWPSEDPHAISREVIGLLGDDNKRFALQARAAARGRDMQWPEVARSYLRSFERARRAS